MRVTLPVAILLCATTSPAFSAGYTLQPFVLPHATSVSAIGINDQGLATGTYVSAAQPYGAGFVGRRGRALTLATLGPQGGPFPRDYIAMPTGINNRGTVVGTYFVGNQVDDFAWRNGTYVAEFSQSVDSQPVFPPFIADGDRVSYNEYSGDGVFTPYAGPLASPTALSRRGAPLVASVNSLGRAAGQFESVDATGFMDSVFLSVPADRSEPYVLFPPGARATFGGWINDAGQVAGSYQDAKNNLHGFVHQQHYTTFDMPSHPTALTTQGIDGTGRVVGTYTSGSTQFAFIYTQGAVTRLRPFPTADAVHVAISPGGAYVVISDTRSDGTSRSWIGTCTGGSAC